VIIGGLIVLKHWLLYVLDRNSHDIFVYLLKPNVTETFVVSETNQTDRRPDFV